MTDAVIFEGFIFIFVSYEAKLLA